MSVYIVAQSTIENPEMLAEYARIASPTVVAGGGRILALDESPEVVEGENPLPRTVLLEFPSREAFRAWYDSAEYQDVLPLRLESAPGSLIVVNGLG